MTLNIARNAVGTDFHIHTIADGKENTNKSMFADKITDFRKI